MIGVFDSGVGGLSVLRHLPDQVPEADILYVADQARAPYGIRSLAEVGAIAHDMSAGLIDKGCETIVIACNTASAAALDDLRSSFEQIAFVGMEPAIKPAVGSTRSGVIGVLATGATFQSDRFESVLRRFVGDAVVHTAACPEWVTLVEEGELAGDKVEDLVRARVNPMLELGADTLVLGCTHFPFLTPVIEKVAGAGVRVVDPAPAVARQVARVDQSREEGRVGLSTTGDHQKFETLARRLLGEVDLGLYLAFDPQ